MYGSGSAIDSVSLTSNSLAASVANLMRKKSNVNREQGSLLHFKRSQTLTIPKAPKEPLYSSTCIMIGLLNLRRLHLLSPQRNPCNRLNFHQAQSCVEIKTHTGSSQSSQQSPRQVKSVTMKALHQGTQGGDSKPNAPPKVRRKTMLSCLITFSCTISLLF